MFLSQNILKVKQIMKYLFIYRNNASNETNNFVTSGVQTKELYITISADLDSLPEGEYTYALVPFNGSDEYYNAMTFKYGGNLLDTTISCLDGDVVLRDLNPATGLFRIGEIGTINTYDDDNNKTYYYEG